MGHKPRTVETAIVMLADDGEVEFPVPVADAGRLDSRREALGLAPMSFGAAGYVVVRNTEEEAHREVARITDVRQSARETEVL